MTNEEIARRIRQARLERGLTQKDLAKFLNKTPSNVSDIERCRVQVSAVDLSLIAQALNKPIGYFYGEDLEGEDIQDIIALLRSQTPEAREQSLQTVRIWLRMQRLQQDVVVSDRELTPEEMQDFILDFMRFLVQFDQLSKQVEQARAAFNQVLKEQGMDLSALLGGGE